MPLVKVWYNPYSFHGVDDLRIACMEIVPAGLCTKQGQLTPGSIEFLATKSQKRDRLSVDVFVDIEAKDYEDRRDTDDRSEAIKAALSSVFPDYTFAVWLKVFNAGWSSDVHDPDSKGDDMSLEAAIERAKLQLAKADRTP